MFKVLQIHFLLFTVIECVVPFPLLEHNWKRDKEMLLNACIDDVIKRVLYENYPSTITKTYETFRVENERYFILKINNNFQETIQKLQILQIWNPTAYFLLIFNGDLKELFEYLSTLYIINVVVLQETSYNIELFTYYPYSETNITNPDTSPKLINTCSSGKLLTNGDIFTNKIPKSWVNSTLQVAYCTVSPYAICVDCYARGIEFEILDILKDRLNFNIKYLPSFDNWGKRMENGNYTNAFGSLQKHEAHIGIGMFQTENDSIRDFDLSFPYMIDQLVFVVPKKDILIEKLMLGVYVWVCVTISYILITIILYISSIATQEHDCYQDILSISLITYRTLLNNSVVILPKKFCGRLIFIIWCLSTWILIIDIQSYLMYFLTHERYEKEIDSIQKLSKSNLKIGLYIHLAETFNKGYLNYEKRIYKKHVHCNIDHYCLNQTAIQKDIASVRPLRSIRYESTNKFLDKNGNPILQIIVENIVMRYVNACFPKGFPLYTILNRLLLWVKAEGFIDYWGKWYTNYVNIIHNKNVQKSINFSSKALNLRQLDGVFKLLMYGLTLALFCFLLELFKFYYYDKKLKRTQTFKQS